MKGEKRKMIIVKPIIEKPYTLDEESIGEYLKELKQTEEEIKKYNWTFEKTGLCNSKYKEDVLNEIKNQIKLCEHYFKTKKRQDLFKWIFNEKYKPNSWNPERDIYTFSNGMAKGIIEIFNNITSTKITFTIEKDCDLYVNFPKIEGYKNLRSEESIKKFIEETKTYLENELNKVVYFRREKNFYEFVLNPKRG